jgi:hypothetical protein
MKNIFKIFLATLLVFSFNACGDSDTIVDGVVDDTTAGAVLRTIADDSNSNVLNSSDGASFWSQVIEVQDEEGGGLLESVDVFVTIRDLSSDNGETPPSEALVKTIPGSEFTTGPVGLPRATAMATFAEATSAMGLSAADYAPGDLYVFEVRLNLTDGRIFGAADAAGIITGGYWASPYRYNAALVCSPVPGDYTIDMHDSYGDGWQTNAGNGGSGITVTLTDANGNESVVEFGMCSPYGGSNVGSFMDESLGGCTGPASTSFFDATTTVTIPAGTTTAIWENPGDNYGEISFEIYAPDGSLLLAVGEGEGTPGLLPVTNCL